MGVRRIRAEDRAQVAEWKWLIWAGECSEDPGESVWVWETGYPPGLRVDGIAVRDRVWLDRQLDSDTDRLPDTSVSR